MSQVINGTNDGVTAEEALPADGARKSFFIDANQDIWLNFHGTAAVDTGIKLKTGLGGYVLRSGDFPVRNAVSLIGAASCSFQIIEMEQGD